jgi:ABC-type branched-subunit amino acid transport system ATPase component/ABC-type branched-subunit amino acid transport system permease subunit
VDTAGRITPRSFLPLVKLAVAIVVIAVLPGLISDQFYLFSITLGAVYFIAVTGLDLSTASGAVSMGTAAFMLIGAYSVALAQVHGNRPAILGVVIGAAICAVVGAITSIPALRLGAFAIAVVTLMYADVVGAIALHFKSFTGGGDGIPALAASVPLSRMWLIVAGCGLVAYVLHHNLLKGPMGRALMITRRGEAVAGSLGVSPGRFKVGSFSIYAVFAGIAGGLYQTLNGPIGTDTFGIDISITLLLMVVLGGVASPTGPLLGTTVLTLIPMILNETAGSGGGTKDLIYGAILLLVVLVFPKGLSGVGQLVLRSRWVRNLRKNKDVRADERSRPTDPEALDALVRQGRGGADGELMADGIFRNIGGLQILRGVSMTVPTGSICGLIGPNGSGKTTMLNSINGLSPVQGGTVTLGGESIGARAAARSKAGIGRTFQTALLADERTVKENLLVGLDTQRKASHIAYAFRFPNALREARRNEALARQWASALGLADLLNAEAGSLTPRERRLLEVGRALATNPKLLLLDEPIAGLTGDEIDELVSIIRLVSDAGVSVILVEHHADLVMSLCHAITVLDAGEVIAAGPPSEIRNDPKVIAAYLGDELEPFESESSESSGVVS